MLKLSRPTQTIAFSVIVLVWSFSAARAEDWHMRQRPLFAKSAFAHGYIHGYDEGFHQGDLDLQMGREFQEVDKQENFRKPKGYENDFGDRVRFEEGYRNGYRVGYIDAYSGRSFRAAELLRSTHQVQSASAPSVAADATFDRGFRDGYATGQKKGLADGRIPDASPAAATSCSIPDAREEDATADYCGAFHRGYELGYSDGFANQRGAGDVVAGNLRDK